MPLHPGRHVSPTPLEPYEPNDYLTDEQLEERWVWFNEPQEEPEVPLDTEDQSASPSPAIQEDHHAPSPAASQGELRVDPAVLEDFKEQVRSSNPIAEVIGEHVKLKRVGKNFEGLCPFHQDNTPSLSVDLEKGIYNCFGCDAQGDVFSFIMRKDGVSFPESVNQLAERAGLDRLQFSVKDNTLIQQRRRTEEIMTLAAQFYHSALPPAIRKRYFHRKYGLTDKTIDSSYLGWANGKLLPHLLKNGVTVKEGQ